MDADHGNDATDRLCCAAADGCTESKLLLTRRAMMGVTASLFSWAYMPGWAHAGSKNDPRLLFVILRGGTDGINVVVPHGDKHYASMRGEIALQKSDTIKLDSDFGLHPSMEAFGRFFKKKEAAVVHAACVPLRNRSHFDAQDNLENGMPGFVSSTYATGWLNRLLGALPKGNVIVKQGALQVGPAPLILRGPEPVLGWSPATYGKVEDPFLYMIRTLYREKDKELYKYLESGLATDRLAEGLDQDDGSISTLRKSFRGAARLLAASNGPRIAVLSVDGWDTHADQGAATGILASLLRELDLAIQDFKRESKSAWDRTVMVCATEFGRTVRVNGDSGTDHGVGTVVLLAGGAIKGGKVHGDWPGLAPNKLYEGSDLKPTTDIRSIFKGVLVEHLDVPKSILNSAVFPQSKKVDPMRGLVRTGKSETDKVVDEGPEVFVPLRPESPIARYRRGQKVAMTVGRAI